MRELTKRGITLTRDLFTILEPFTEYPLDNFAFSNHLEQFWNYIKKHTCVDLEGNTAACCSTYQLTYVESETET